MKYGYIFEVAAKAVSSLHAGTETLGDCKLTDTQADELFKLVSDIEEASLEFDRLARRIVAEKAMFTKENGNG